MMISTNNGPLDIFKESQAQPPIYASMKTTRQQAQEGRNRGTVHQIYGRFAGGYFIPIRTHRYQKTGKSSCTTNDFKRGLKNLEHCEKLLRNKPFIRQQISGGKASKGFG